MKRTSEAPGGVSHGLEKGWLTFVSATGKRRLAPFPTEWKEADATELERLCASARTANPPRFEVPRPRIRPARATAVDLPVAPPVASAEDPVQETGLVRDVIRAFAQEARRDKVPAIEAMVRLKALLAERYQDEVQDDATRADLGDLRRIRRWFVEAYYFERPA